MRRTLAALAVALHACGADESIVIVPVIDSPDDPNAAVLADLTTIRLTIEDIAGADVVPTRDFQRGATIAIDGIEFADNLFMQIDGFNGATAIGVGRTCAFNVQRDNAPTPHIFLSRLGKAADLAFTAAPRIAGAAIVTPDQKVLLLGGDSELVERFDPIVNQFELVDGASLPTRTGAAFALLGKNAPRPALFGGFAGGSAASTIDVVNFDGRVDQFPDGGMVLARSNVVAARLSETGQVLVTGGRNADLTASNAVFTVLLDESQNEVTVEPVTTGLSAAREGHVMTQLGDGRGAKILITGGASGGIATNKTEIFDPIAGQLLANLDPRFDLVQARTDHEALVMPDGSIVVVGGVNGTTPVVTVEQLSPITGFTLAGTLPTGAPVIDFSLITLPDGRGMIVGGRSAVDDEPSRAIYFVNFSDGNQISVNIAADTLAVGRVNPQLAVLCDGTVLISGGTSDASVVERFNPNVPKALGQ